MLDVNLLNLGLGRSIYRKEQMEDFARFQDSQNTRKAYLAEASELAYLGRSGGEWGLGLTELARDQIVNAVGYRLIPLYRLIGPTAVIVILVMRPSKWLSLRFDGQCRKARKALAESEIRWRPGRHMCLDSHKRKGPAMWRSWRTGRPHGGGESMGWHRPFRLELEERTFP